MTSDINKELANFENRYFSLVWYARSNPEKINDENLRLKIEERMNKISNEYSSDVEKLISCHDNFQHGFNSGCLAAFRLALGLLSNDSAEREFAIENFPFLDT